MRNNSSMDTILDEKYLVHIQLEKNEKRNKLFISFFTFIV